MRANDKPRRAEVLSGLNDLAKARGQTLPQMAIAWVLRHGAMTSVVTGASRVEQVEANVAALANLEFTSDELGRIDALTSA